MFLIYGGALLLLFEPVHNALRGWPCSLRGLVYVAGIFAVEYATGWLLREGSPAHAPGTTPATALEHPRLDPP